MYAASLNLSSSGNISSVKDVNVSSLSPNNGDPIICNQTTDFYGSENKDSPARFYTTNDNTCLYDSL
jgi:hypothetical protein